MERFSLFILLCIIFGIIELVTIRLIGIEMPPIIL